MRRAASFGRAVTRTPARDAPPKETCRTSCVGGAPSRVAPEGRSTPFTPEEGPSRTRLTRDVAEGRACLCATELGEPFADKLELFLLNERNFAAPADGVTERCPFEPEVALRAFEGAEWIAVVVDFDCNLMTTTSSQGQLTLPSVSFGPGRDELLEIVKEAFPNDPTIQSLR